MHHLPPLVSSISISLDSTHSFVHKSSCECTTPKTEMEIIRTQRRRRRRNFFIEIVLGAFIMRNLNLKIGSATYQCRRCDAHNTEHLQNNNPDDSVSQSLSARQLGSSFCIQPNRLSPKYIYISGRCF